MCFHHVSSHLWSQWVVGLFQAQALCALLPVLTASLGVPSPPRRPMAVSATPP